MRSLIHRRQEIFLDTGDTGDLTAYQQRRAQKREAAATITPEGKRYRVRLDMDTTGQTLNSLGRQAYLQLAVSLGNPTATVDGGLLVASLTTAEKTARKLLQLGTDKKFRQ